jgi:O-antigen/teichoic acid export membrane protein
MNRLRRAAQATIVAQCFNWTSLLLSLVFVPLYLSWLGEERYGLLLTGIAIAGYLMFSDAGITWASMLLIAEANGKNDRPGVAAVFRTSFPFAVLSSLLVVVAIALSAIVLELDRGPTWLPHHPEFSGLLIAIGASAVAGLIFSPFYNLLIGLQEAHLAAIYQGSGRLGGMIATAVLASSGAPLGWVYGGNVAGVVIVGVLAGLHCRKRHPWAFRRGPFWEPLQGNRQLRTGLSSLLMQAGTVFLATAPVLATSLGAAPSLVPYVSIPISLLNAPLGILSSLSASLQSGYGEAMGRGESDWVAETVNRLLAQGFVWLGLLGCGWMLLAADFVDLWTKGRIEMTPLIVLNALLIAGSAAVVTTMRYALTGINRHRRAAVGEFVGGLLAVVAGIFVVRLAGFDWVGLVVFLSVILATGWLYPLELKRALGGPRIFPAGRFWIALFATVALAYGAGWITRFAMTSLPVWSMIFATGTVVTAVFLFFAGRWLRTEIDFAMARIPGRWIRSKVAPAVGKVSRHS